MVKRVKAGSTDHDDSNLAILKKSIYLDKQLLRKKKTNNKTVLYSKI